MRLIKWILNAMVVLAFLAIGMVIGLLLFLLSLSFFVEHFYQPQNEARQSENR